MDTHNTLCEWSDGDDDGVFEGQSRTRAILVSSGSSDSEVERSKILTYLFLHGYNTRKNMSITVRLTVLTYLSKNMSKAVQLTVQLKICQKLSD